MEFGDCRFDVDRRELTRAGEMVRLTSAEAALLGALAARPGEVISRIDLARGTLADGDDTERRRERIEERMIAFAQETDRREGLEPVQPGT